MVETHKMKGYKTQKITFGAIIGNRGFFPDHLAKSGRKDILGVLKKNGFNSIALSVQDTKYGAIETFADTVEAAVVLEQVASMAMGTIMINPNQNPIDKVLLDKHYLRKHGKDAYYGQK
jgi:L-fucose isomerase-like protein